MPKQPNLSFVVRDGNPVDLQAAWSDVDGNPETPAAVRYQVFDHDTRAPIGPAVAVSDPAPVMRFTVPGSMLPGNGTPKRRRLTVAVEAVYAAGESFTDEIDVYVDRSFSVES